MADANAVATSADHPLVSIILPTFNRAKWLPAAVAACRQQTYTNWEMLIVDDGSTDETAQVATGCARADERIRYLWQSNQKLPAALNRGHHASRGGLLTWTSDDNRFEPDALQVMVGHLRQNPKCGLVYCNVKMVSPEGTLLETRRLPGPERLWEGSCVGACFLYRRQVYEQVGDYDPRLFLAEDYDYWLRIKKRFRIDHLAQIAPYQATRHDESLTETRRPEVEWQCARARARHVGNRWRAWQMLSQGHFEAAYAWRVRGQLRRSLWHTTCGIVRWPGNPRNWRHLAGLLRRAVSGSN